MLSECRQKMSNRLVVACLIVLLALAMLLLENPTLAQNITSREAIANEVEEHTQQQAIDRLTDIRQSLIQRHQKLKDLKKQLEIATEEETKKELQAQLGELNKSVQNLNESFEQIAIGGIDLEVFDEGPAATFNWQQELIQITQPILRGFKELTEKPRKIEQLRRKIDRYVEQLKVIQQALDSIAAFRKQPLLDILSDKLDMVAVHWEERKTDTEDALEAVSYQLASLQGEDVSALDTIKEALEEFIRGRD